MPEIFRKILDDDSLYAVWEITESVEELLKMISLRPAEKELFDSFVAENRKKQWLAYRILIRSLLLPDDFPIEYNESGKPYLAGSRYHISVTHSGHYAGVILSSRGQVGIDIEAVRPKIERIREKYLHPDELLNITGPEAPEILTLAWCAKEALYKLYGHRGLDFTENIRLQLPESHKKGYFRGEIRHKGQTHFFELYSRSFGRFILVYVMETPSEG